MGSTEVFVAVVTGVFGIFGLILTGSLWRIFKGMIEGLQAQLIEQRDHMRGQDKKLAELQSQIDVLENINYEKDIEILRLQNKVDEYVALAQESQFQVDQFKSQLEKTMAENIDLTGEVERLRKAE